MTTFLQNNWYGGETNDKYIATQQGQVLEARSVNINKSSKYFYNANGNLPYTTSEYDLGGSINIRQILIGPSFADRLVFFSDGQIYNLSGLATDTNKNIVNAGVIGSKGFIIYSNGSIDTWIYNSGVNDLGLSTLTSNTLSGLTINSAFAPYYIDNQFLYIATGSKVYEIDTSATWVLSGTLELTAGGQVRGITKIGDNFNIYVNYGTTSKQFIWGGDISVSYSYEINWYDRTILNVANVNNLDYVVCEDGLYIANGYQPTCLIQRTFISDYTNAIETYRNKIFIPGYKCVYTYQFNKPGFPGNFSTELILPTTTSDQNVSCMTINPKVFDTNSGKYTQDIYIAYLNYFTAKDYRSYIVQYTNDRFLSTRNPIGGNVRLNPIIGLKGTKKSAKKVRLGYYLHNNTGPGSQSYTYAGVSKQFYFKHSIGVFAEKDQDTKVSCYIGDFTTKPTVGSVYNIMGNNSTVTNVDNLFEANSKWHGWIEFEVDNTANLNYINKTITNITKVSGTGDDTGIYIALHLGEIVKIITDNDLNGKSIMAPGDFEEIIFTIHITEGAFTSSQYENERLQTRVYDFAFVYDEIQNDLS